jgi:adenosylcobinamide-GDP ribazoletransferase
VPATSPDRSFPAACRFAVGTLTVFPVRVTVVDRAIAGGGMTLAPFVGVLLGTAAAAVLIAVNALSGSALLAAILAVGSLAWLTRALHLDGLADLADGLGSGKPAEPALDIMKRSDIGPFGVVTLVFTLLVQVAVLTRLGHTAAVALVAACATGRLAITWACGEGVPAARPDGLGAFVAGTVRRRTAIAVTAVTAAVVALLGLPVNDGGLVNLVLPALPAMGAGLAAAALLRRRAVRRLGGITGDVLGALVETATTVTLVAFALI